MSDVALFYMRILPGELDAIAPEYCEQYLQQLPMDKRQRLHRLKNETTRRYSLLALGLLQYAARACLRADFRLQDLAFPAERKPRWQPGAGEGFDFSISHTRGLIMLAISHACRVGIDVERKRHLRSTAFQRILRPEEMAVISSAPERFFDYWSQKEAVVKAADNAGAASMRAVQLHPDRASFDGQVWFLYCPWRSVQRPVEPGTADAAWQQGYAAWLACDRAQVSIQLEEVPLEALLADLSHSH